MPAAAQPPFVFAPTRSSSSSAGSSAGGGSSAANNKLTHSQASKHSSLHGHISALAGSNKQQSDASNAKAKLARTRDPKGKGFVNWPARHLQSGDYFNKSVLFALSTRPHHLGRDRLLATKQRPSDQELICVEYRTKQDMLEDFALKLDQCVLIEVNPLGPAAALGVAEGFQLVYVDGRRVKNVEVFDALEEIESFPCKLGFVSPLAEPPNLSDRQVAQRLGMNHVKQKMLHKATELMDKIQEEEGRRFRLTFSKFKSVLEQAGILWLEKKELRDLFEQLDRDDSGDVDPEEWKFGVADKLLFDDKFARLVKNVNRHHIRDASAFFETELKRKKRDALTFAEFSSGLFKGGITWMTRQQMRWIFEYIDEDGCGKIQFSDWAARFQFDLIEAAHEIQRYLTGHGGDSVGGSAASSAAEDEHDGSGAEAKRKPAAGAAAGKNAKPSNAAGGAGAASSSKAKSVKNPISKIPEEMDLDLFILTLHTTGVTWLTEEQIVQLFDMIDRNGNGLITPDEVTHIGNLVDQYFEVRASMRRSMTFNTTISSRKSMAAEANFVLAKEDQQGVGGVVVGHDGHSIGPGSPEVDGAYVEEQASPGWSQDPGPPTAGQLELGEQISDGLVITDDRTATEGPRKATSRATQQQEVLTFDEVARDLIQDALPQLDSVEASLHSVGSIENRMSRDISEDILAVSTLQHKAAASSSSYSSAEEVLEQPVTVDVVVAGGKKSSSSSSSEKFHRRLVLDGTVVDSESASAAEELTNALISSSIGATGTGTEDNATVIPPTSAFSAAGVKLDGVRGSRSPRGERHHGGELVTGKTSSASSTSSVAPVFGDAMERKSSHSSHASFVEEEIESGSEQGGPAAGHAHDDGSEAALAAPAGNDFRRAKLAQEHEHASGSGEAAVSRAAKRDVRIDVKIKEENRDALDDLFGVFGAAAGGGGSSDAEVSSSSSATSFLLRGAAAKEDEKRETKTSSDQDDNILGAGAGGVGVVLGGDNSSHSSSDELQKMLRKEDENADAADEISGTGSGTAPEIDENGSSSAVASSASSAAGAFARNKPRRDDEPSPTSKVNEKVLGAPGSSSSGGHPEDSGEDALFSSEAPDEHGQGEGEDEETSREHEQHEHDENSSHAEISMSISEEDEHEEGPGSASGGSAAQTGPPGGGHDLQGQHWTAPDSARQPPPDSSQAGSMDDESIDADDVDESESGAAEPPLDNATQRSTDIVVAEEREREHLQETKLETPSMSASGSETLEKTVDLNAPGGRQHASGGREAPIQASMNREYTEDEGENENDPLETARSDEEDDPWT
eukprot:CAMPEP_0179000368 /NCGR_PEP_ID=MMETSP0795-20121207/10629_1 /TAXON_ID=88552 /ORGANISM="Amoebophrya sp., Strain Ameob2" /LENGTH=1304 /DNA_ID=CAMNT_0020693349 /DNA_START=200 /DNA_END=4114 /DNA_ORIENTATION=-